MISKLELRSLQKEKHFGYKVEIAQKLSLQQLQIQSEIELRQSFKWQQYFNTSHPYL